MSHRHLLALNVGSTTVKAAIYVLRADASNPMYRLTECARVEIPAGGDPQERLTALLQACPGARSAPGVIVHRIVHGGGRGDDHELDDAVMSDLEALAPLAPLHQPTALRYVRAARARWPQARHGAAFDTSFHARLAPWSRRLPIPAEWHALGVQRYGFHGLAFHSALRLVAERAPQIQRGRAVLAHLGGGCSLCAVEGGVSRDTTMTLTPLGGVPSPTRSGDLDPGAIFYLLRTTGLDAASIEDRLSHGGGLAGIAAHGDMRKLLAGTDAPSQLAVDHFVMRIAQAIAAMATAIGGLDHLVFSGGIGHRAPVLRERICARLGWLGLSLDLTRNATAECRIDAGKGPAVWNIEVDEERILAESALAWL